ncbi:hypothetical protein HAX54_014613 [Datura stramonium]|uniref:Uncharacterized protein n=1 Tax=Datura stramonium TaxID=4076 RepID=A0ABS8RZ37_DATST|nr:hypothetical protein [Datura stramonium]
MRRRKNGKKVLAMVVAAVRGISVRGLVAVFLSCCCSRVREEEGVMAVTAVAGNGEKREEGGGATVAGSGEGREKRESNMPLNPMSTALEDALELLNEILVEDSTLQL